MTTFQEDVVHRLDSGFQNLLIDTTELHRCELTLMRLAQDFPDSVHAVVIWDCISGLKIVSTCDRTRPEFAEMQWTYNSDTEFPDYYCNPLQALEFIASVNFPVLNGLVIMRNLHVFLNKDTALAQLWQNTFGNRSYNNSGDDSVAPPRPAKSCIPVILGTNAELIKPLQPTVTQLDFRLPDRQELTAIFAEHLQNCFTSNPNFELPSQERQEVICNALLGMTGAEAEDVLALSTTRHRNLSSTEVLETLEDHKASILKRSKSLTYIHRSKIAEKDDVGGYDIYKSWISERKSCYTQAAREHNIDRPKGVVLLGPPGTGKSMVAQVTAKMLDMPLVILDVASLFGSLVGQTEQATIDAIRTIEALCGAVVLMDEVDKVWAGVNDSSGDSGVSRRVFGRFLTWMNEKTDDSFIIMTMNRKDGIPPELFRKGRFDEIFSTDLPSASERREIVEIHLRKRGLIPADIVRREADWDTLMMATTDCVGSELEAVVTGARLRAFHRDGQGLPTMADLMEEAQTLVKLITTDGDNIRSIQEFCRNNTRPVSTTVKARQATKARARKLVVGNN